MTRTCVRMSRSVCEAGTIRHTADLSVRRADAEWSVLRRPLTIQLLGHLLGALVLDILL